MPARTSPEDITRILDAYDRGLSRNEIIRETGLSAGAVTKYVHLKRGKDAFDRKTTQAAVAALKVDLAEQRLRLALNEQVLTELDQARQLAVYRGKAKWKTVMRDADGADVVRELDFIPSIDWQRHKNSFSSASTAIGRITSIDSGRRDEATNSLLAELGDALGINDRTTPDE